MKKQNLGFTLVELFVVVGLIALLLVLLIPALARGKAKAQRIACVGNLKCVGLAYRVWAGDNADQYPAQNTNATGWREIATTTNAARLCWTNYVIMANELGQAPRTLTCPSDERIPATILQTNQSTGIGNTNISYFVGVGASDTQPSLILAGDRNLAPGPQSSNDFGFSPANGMGADVILSTNSTVCWSLKMHSKVGSVVLGDGSVQQFTTAKFRADCLPYVAGGNLWPPGCTNTNGTFRLIFP